MSCAAGTRPGGPGRTRPTTVRAGCAVSCTSSERPAEAEDRAVPGHWEGDLLLGTATSCMATLVERHSRFVMLVKIPGRRTSLEVTAALAERIQTLPAELFRSLTWDQGKEMSEHAKFSIDTGVQVYFCDPSQPVAARQQREHQRAAASVLPERQVDGRLHPSRPRRGRRETQRQTSTNPELDDTVTETRPSVAMTG